MKVAKVASISALAALCAACTPPDEGTPTDPSNLPQRKAGLWRQNLSVGGRPQSATDQCFGEGPVVTHGADEMCDPPLTTRLKSGGLKIVANCKAKNGQARSKVIAIFRGDPATRYTLDGTTYYSSASWAPMRPLGGGAHYSFSYLGTCNDNAAPSAQ